MKITNPGPAGRVLTRWAVTGLVLGAAIGGATTPSYAQCMVTNTMVNTSGATISVYKNLNGSYLCNSVGNNNVLGCFPGAAPSATNLLVASANTAATNPSCQWSCTGGCGTVTIDSTDGLPVELMDFEVVPASPVAPPAAKEDGEDEKPEAKG